MKNSRHIKILEIITENIIETQDDLIEKLRESGFAVTQATISRDIKQLGLVKTATKSGGYQYTASKTEVSGNETKFKNIMKETVLSAQNAENIVVVKTYPGMANAAAAAIDAMKIRDIVGTLAGDDNILVILRTNEDAEKFCEMVTGMLS